MSEHTGYGETLRRPRHAVVVSTLEARIRLDGVPPEVLDAAPIRYEDGANDDWMNPPPFTRYL